MIKTASRFLAASAALGLIAAPMMANANTRAGDSGATFSVSSAQPGLGRAADGEGQGEGGGAGGALLGVAAGAAIIAGILVATDVIGEDDDDCISPGAC
jgi:hypothetical protein